MNCSGQKQPTLVHVDPFQRATHACEDPELDPAAARQCADAGISVAAGSIFDVPVPCGPWDVITFWDVLDHLEWPDRALKVAVAQVASGGMVVVRGRNGALHVPLKHLTDRNRNLFTRIGIPDVSVVHRWGFSANAWQSLLQQARLVDVRIRPALPTAGDRYSVWRNRIIPLVVKAMWSGSASLLAFASGNRLYTYPSVLLTGRVP